MRHCKALPTLVELVKLENEQRQETDKRLTTERVSDHTFAELLNSGSMRADKEGPRVELKEF